jgi:hypothetical protein
MTEVKFEFNIRQEVKINLIQKVGEVRGLYLNVNGNQQYLVGYADNTGKINEQWFDSFELDADLTADESKEEAAE